MTKITRHVGTYNDKRCAVVLQLPENRLEVHILETESLPDQLHQQVMTLIESPQGQALTWIGDLFSRSVAFDGTNLLDTLYKHKFIQEVDVNKVFLTPTPNNPVNLGEVLRIADPQGMAATLAAANALAPVAVDDIASDAPADVRKLAEQAQAQLNTTDTDKFNPHLANLKADTVVQNQSIAKGLLQEADLLTMEVNAKRNQAYALDPSLRPATPAPAPVAVSTATVETIAVVEPIATDNKTSEE